MHLLIRVSKHEYICVMVLTCNYLHTYRKSVNEAAVGNVPFASDTLSYNGKSLQIHDYFFAETLDKVRSGGVVAFVCADPVWRAVQTFEPTTLLVFMTVLAVYLLTRFLRSGHLPAAYFAMLILGLLYYRWRLSDSQHMLVRFIRENFRLHEKLNENGIY